MTTNKTRAFVAALAMFSVARAAETVSVHALECVFEVPAAYEFNVTPASEVWISNIGRLPGQIIISALDRKPSADASMKLRESVTKGPLTIERFAFEENGVKRSMPYVFTRVRGRKQQITFGGLTAAEVDAYVAQCLKTLPPALLAATARAGEGCKGELRVDQTMAAMGSEVRWQPVFSDGGLKGWRLYSTQTSALLRAQGIEKGALMSHICGVPGGEIFANEGIACCSVDVSREFEVTFQAAGHEKPIVIKR